MRACGAAFLVSVVLGLLFLAQSASCEEAAAGAQWKRSLSVGFSMTDGNSKTLLLTEGMSAEMESGHHLLRLTLDGTYGEADGEKNAQNGKVGANWKRTLDRVYGYLDASLLSDDMAEIDYRALAGPGFGYYLVKNDLTKLGADIGAAYVMERTGNASDDYLTVRFGERLDHTLSKTATLWESLEYLPRVDDFQDYLLNAEAGVQAALTTKLNLRLVGQMKYDSTPAPEQKKLDTTVTTALNVNF